MCIALRIRLFWIWNDDFGQVAKSCQHFRLLPAILDVQQTMMSSAVGRRRVDETSFVHVNGKKYTLFSFKRCVVLFVLSGVVCTKL